MKKEKKVKDIMVPIEKFDTIDVDAPLCEGLLKLKQHYDLYRPQSVARFNKSIFVVDRTKKIIGKLSMFHFIRALVPKESRGDEPKTVQTMLSSRVKEVQSEISKIQERFYWVNRRFSDLVHQEAQKSIRECMAPAHAVLKEDDTLNWAIYNMFKLNVRELLVCRDTVVTGVLNFTNIFDELMEIVGPECAMIMRKS
jgi:hypothetical protein